MKIMSRERTTGMGVNHSTRILTQNGWERVSNLLGAIYHGRFRGVHKYSIEINHGFFGKFNRSNSGIENVSIYEINKEKEVEVLIQSYSSFSDAYRWANEKLGLEIIFE